MSNLDPSEMSRRQQMVATYRMAKKTDRHLGLILLATFLVAGGLGFVLFQFVLPGAGVISLVLAIIGGVMLGTARDDHHLRPPRPEGGVRPDAGHAGRRRPRPVDAAPRVDAPTRWWRSTSSRTWSTGSSARRASCWSARATRPGCRALLATEERRHSRVASEVPIHHVVVGDGEGQVPLTKLVRHVTKLGKSVKGAELTDLLSRLRAIDANRPNLPIPKGPMPTSMKGMRGQMKGR